MTTTELKFALTRREGVEIEYKPARGGFPGSMWETVSAFANTNGGVNHYDFVNTKVNGSSRELEREYKRLSADAFPMVVDKISGWKPTNPSKT